MYVLALVVGGDEYYYIRSFSIAIPQGFVGVKYTFWDYEFG